MPNRRPLVNASGVVREIASGDALVIDAIPLSDGATVTVDPTQGNRFTLESALGRNLDMSGAGYDGQLIVIRFKNTGGSPITHSLVTGAANKFRYLGAANSLAATAAGATDYIAVQYHAADSRWDVVSYSGADFPKIAYEINVQALTSSPADGATVYFGVLPKAPVTTAGQSKIYVRKAGKIRRAEIYVYSGTAGSNENWSLYIRVNNTTDYLIQTVGANTSERVFSNTSLNSGNGISLSAGDYFEIKGVQPTWATNPLTTIYGGRVYFEES